MIVEEQAESSSILGPGLGPEASGVTPVDQIDLTNLGPVLGLLPPSDEGPDVGVEDDPSVAPIDQEFLPPILGDSEGVPPFDPAIPGPDFGVSVVQGFQPDVTPEPPDLGPVGPGRPPFFL